MDNLPDDWIRRGVHWHAYIGRRGDPSHCPDVDDLEAQGVTPAVLRTPDQVANWLIQHEINALMGWSEKTHSWRGPHPTVLGHHYEEFLFHACYAINYACHYEVANISRWLIVTAVADTCHPDDEPEKDT